MDSSRFQPGSLVASASRSTVGSLFASQARCHPRRVALADGTIERSYAELADRSQRLASLLASRGVGAGGRIALLSENRIEVPEVFLAAARLGAIVACQNWRLAGPELRHCLSLVEPAATVVSPRFSEMLAAAGGDSDPIAFGDDYEKRLARSPLMEAEGEVDPEDPLLILYTSGTTGLPKAAVMSHRAEVYRSVVVQAEFGATPDDAFVAWSPLYHMGAVDNTLAALMTGGRVIVVDGFDVGRLCEIVATERVGWLLLMPGMVNRFADALEAREVVARGVRLCGVMADLVPPAAIARVTSLLGAPYANTFGATETGCPPGSASPIPIGVAPRGLSKRQSPFCEVRLLDPEGRDVPEGSPGELCMRGPTLFSGYWREPEVNRRDFRGGWFHMGDVFVRNPDGSLDFVDRAKYLIKSGGENIYPAEIERVIARDARVAAVAVVRAADAKWGEVPVAFVARKEDSLSEQDVLALCRGELARYKQPKEIRFIALDAFPRSASGKVQRHQLEAALRDESAQGR